MSSFADRVAASLPYGFRLPDAFRKLFDWMEPRGHVETVEGIGLSYVGLFPRDHPASLKSCVAFSTHEPEWFGAWLDNEDPDIFNRVAIIMQTGGDGSRAGLWLDDQGRQRIVHMGSGSGSTMVCVLTDDPVDLLRLCAIGYDELCWPERFDQTPAEIREENAEEDDAGDLILPDPAEVEPVAFRGWVETTFGVTTPETASEIVKETADMDAGESDDPFWRWTREHSN